MKIFINKIYFSAEINMKFRKLFNKQSLNLQDRINNE